MIIGRAVLEWAAVAAVGLTLGTAAPALAQNAGGRSGLPALKRDYRRPPPLPIANPALVNLGRELFFDPRISASGNPLAPAATRRNSAMW